MSIGNSMGIAVVLVLHAGFLGVAAGDEATSEPFQVGQRWVYQHQGPRPGAIEPNAIDGRKVLQVISTFEKDGARRWVIEERYTEDPNVVGRLLVDRNRQLTGFEIENEKNEMGRMMYDVAVPYQAPELEVGGRKTLETILRVDSADFALPMTIIVERLADETIQTPAGEFADCQRYKTTTRSTINIKIAKIRSTEERQRWYHPSVNGLVKEVYHKSPIKFLGKEFKPGYTATSVLTAFDVGEVQSTFDPNRPPSPGSPGPKRSLGWLGVGGLILLAGIGLVLARRNRPRGG